MISKNHICENCKKFSKLHYVKMIDYTSDPIEETLNWWCIVCISLNNSRSRQVWRQSQNEVDKKEVEE
jgi:hypothetical protein